MDVLAQFLLILQKKTMEFFAIFFSIYGWIAIIIVIAILAAVGVTVSLTSVIGYMLLFMVVYALLFAAWYWFCYGMHKWLKKNTRLQRWFENEFLDLKYPSRVRRRRNKRNKSGS